MKKNKTDRVRLPFLILAAAVILCGCGGSKPEQLEAEIKQTREQAGILQARLAEAEANIRSVRSENERLMNLVRQLDTTNRLVSRRIRELAEWSVKLTDGYGPGIWYMDESTLPVFAQPVPSGDVAAIVEQLNKRFQKDGLPKILLAGIENSRARVGVDDAELLTQRLGSHGAESYLNAVTYTLASAAGIDCVRFEFKGGDHARPGERCKGDDRWQTF